MMTQAEYDALEHNVEQLVKLLHFIHHHDDYYLECNGEPGTPERYQELLEKFFEVH